MNFFLQKLLNLDDLNGKAFPASSDAVRKNIYEVMQNHFTLSNATLILPHKCSDMGEQQETTLKK